MSRECHVRPPNMEADALVRHFISQVKSSPNDEDLKEVISECMLLIARVKEYRWTHNNIANPLLNCLGENHDLLLWVFKSIGMVRNDNVNVGQVFDARRRCKRKKCANK